MSEAVLTGIPYTPQNRPLWGGVVQTDTLLTQLMILDRPALLRQAEKIQAANLAEERELCEGSLIEFMIRAWPEVEPGELDVNWHHREIAAALEAITDGENRALIINQPPRTMKTLLCNVGGLTSKLRRG